MIESLYSDMGPFAEDDVSGELLDFMLAIGHPLDRINAIVGEGDGEEPGWSAALDLNRAESAGLPWLGQFVGAEITPAMTPVEARDVIGNPQGFGVGTVAAMVAALKRTLTGSKRVIVYERNPGDEDLYMRSLASETPDEDLSRAAVVAQKPWHLVLNYEAVTGRTYIDLEAEYTGRTYADLEAEGLTYEELEATLP